MPSRTINFGSKSLAPLPKAQTFLVKETCRHKPDQCSKKTLKSLSQSILTEIAIKMSQISAGICRFCDRNWTRKRGIFVSDFGSRMLSSAISTWNLSQTLKTKAFLARFYFSTCIRSRKNPEIAIKTDTDWDSTQDFTNTAEVYQFRFRIHASDIRNGDFCLESHPNPRNQSFWRKGSIFPSAFQDGETLTGNIRFGSWEIRERAQIYRILVNWSWISKRSVRKV